MKRLILPSLGLLGLLGGCSSPTPMLDSNFGKAVLYDKQAQYLNPQAGMQPGKPAGLDGKSAQAVLDRYHQTYKSPPPAFNVINIGGTIAGGSGGGGQ